MNLGLCSPHWPSASGRGRGLRAVWGPLTVDEAQAGCVEQVFLQVVLTGAAILPAQHLLPARHSPHEGQMVTTTVVAQQCLHLVGGGVPGSQGRDQRGGHLGTEGSGGPEGRGGPRAGTGSDLVHLRPVLQAAAEGVSGEAGDNH